LGSTPALAGFDEGKAAYDKKDYKTAVTQLRPLAEAGDDRAMVLLGNMYNEGSGVLISHHEAMRLFKKAAIEKNNTQAMDNIAAMYFSAIGTAQNIPAAIQWFERSAKLGDQTGAFFYATIFIQGNKTTPQMLPDPMQAYKWFRIAAAEKQNDKLAASCANAADRIAAKLLDGPRKEAADKEVAAWKPVTAKELGAPPADPPEVPRQDPRKTAPSTPAPAPAPGGILKKY
jgi:TPR repeat protein